MNSDFFKLINEITGIDTSENCRKSVLERIYLELIETPKNHLVSKSILCINLIELLSQYQSGKLHKKGNQKRFDRFLSGHTQLSSDTNRTLYLFRNALVHNGGSYASDQKGNIYRFILRSEGSLMNSKSRTMFEINVLKLEELTFLILSNLSVKLVENKNLRQRFIDVHKRIGLTS